MIRLCFIIISGLFILNILSGASVTGLLLDPDGYPVPYANVYIEDLKTGSMTNLKGEFEIENVPEGQYTINASYISFVTITSMIEVPCDKITLKFDKEAVFYSDAVVVSATRTPKTLKDTPLPVTFIPKETIEETQAITLADAIEHVPGIILMPNGFTRKSATIHGLPEEYSLLMVDGQRIYGRHADAKDYDQIPVGMIDHIELIKGPSSILYGSDAVAGVINIITKSGQRTPSFELYGCTGSDQQYITRFNAGGNLGDISNFLSTSYNHSGQMAEGYNFSNVTIRYNGRYNISEKSELHFGGGYFNEETEDMPIADGHEEGGPYLTDDVYDIKAGYNYKTASGHSYDLSIYTQNQDRWDNRPGREDRSWDRRHYRLEGITQHKWNKHELVFGIEGRNESLEQSQLPEEKNQYLISLFTQEIWNLNSNLALITAARIENHDEWGLIFVPRFGVAYRFFNQFNIRLAGGSSFSAPSLEDLYIESYFHPWGGGFWLGGNPNLKPEKGIGINLDFEWIPLSEVMLNLGLFYNELKDRIASVETNQQINGSPVQKQINSEKAVSSGVDFQFNWIFMSGWKLGLSYGYLHTEDKMTGKPFNMTPYNKAGLNLTWKQRKWGTLINISTTYLSKRYTDSETLKEVYITDINIEQKVINIFNVFISADNLFNQELYPSSYTNYGRSYYAGIRIRK
jgi:outer membrane receptor for ferrienterochelin and colicins